MAADTLQDLPPSAKLVYKALEYTDGPMSFSDLVDETRLGESTLQDALRRLRAADLVKREPDPANPRGHRYSRA